MYFLVWFIPIVLFWLVLRVVPMLFFMLVYAWYPILGGIISYKLVTNSRIGKWKYLSPIGMGCINCSVFYITYGITNMLSMSNVAWDDLGIFILNAIGSAIGLLAGIVMTKLSKRIHT